MGTVLFLTGGSRGNALKLMGESYQKYFTEIGYDFVEIDFRDHATSISKLNRTLNERPIEFALSFMNYGSTLCGNDENGKSRNIWQGIGVPFLSLIGDSPSYYFDLHICRSPVHACLYGFPEHEAMRRLLLAQSEIGYVGGFKPLLLDELEPEELDFKAKASGQLFFLKNGNGPKQLWDSWNVLKARPLHALRELADYLGSDLANPEGNHIDDLVMRYFSDHGFDMSRIPRLRLFFVAQLDDYLRRLKSTMMAEALMDFPVHIVGENWGHLDFSGKRATHTEACNYEKSRDLVRNGLGVIDMSPNTGLAPHDRPCRAFGAYTLCLTNEQQFFQQSFTNYKDFSFQFECDSLRDKVADVLEHPARYVDVGVEAAQIFRQVSPPREAAQYLVDTAAMIRLDQRRDRLPASPDYFVWPPGALAAA